MSAATLIGLMADHVWQSTLFALGAGLLTLAFRQSRAQVRYAIWMAASVKFLVPFALLVAIGGAANVWTDAPAPPARPLALAYAGVVAQPFTQQRFEVPADADFTRARRRSEQIRTGIATVWMIGTILLLARWAIRWMAVVRVARRATPLRSGEPVAALRRLEGAWRPHHHVPVLATDRPIELGVFGVIRPVLLWPRAIGERLSADQVAAIVAHELCHVRRRDNLTAAIHMVVETMFWFHPLVWWISGRLLDERERACDEAVLLLGNEPRGYAEGLVRLCEFYVESPVACVAGVTGSDLKSRIYRIMRGDTGRALSRRARTLLQATALGVMTAPIAIAAMAPPLAIGLPAERFFRIPRLMLAWAPRDPTHAWDPNARFATAAIFPTSASRDGGYRVTPAGHFGATRVTVRDLIQLAYSPEARLWPERLAAAPSWIDDDRFDVNARAPEPFVNDGDGEPRGLVAMLRNLLADRFGLRLRIESRILPVYALVVSDPAVAASALHRPHRSCWRPPEDPTPSTLVPFGTMCQSPLDGRLIESASMRWLASTLTALAPSHHIVRDETGLPAKYDFRLPPAGALEQLGVRLELREEPVDVFVIEHIERPTIDPR